MTCRCKHQFCYICGGKWSHEHLCNRVPGGVTAIHNYGDGNLFNCNCVDGCGVISCLLKVPLRLISWLLALSIVVLIAGYVLAKDLFLLMFAILLGMTFFTIECICQKC